METKLCSKCNLPWPIADYRPGKAQCKQCRYKVKKAWEKGPGREKDLARRRKWYKEHAEERCSTSRERRRIVKQTILDTLGIKSCCRCPEARLVCLDFHHTDANKEKGVSKITNVSRALEEARKCIVLCSNCHRVEHETIQKEKGSRIAS